MGVALFLVACGKAQVVGQSAPSELKRTVFSAGEGQVNSYRIPSLLTAKDGTLLVFCEARRESWKDKSRTDVVLKRSCDGGYTWSPLQDLTQGTDGAYMDPTPVLDAVTGRIFLFATYWPSDDHSGLKNRAILVTSDDHGKTWTAPEDVTSMLPETCCIGGFGPGSGLQMTGEPFKERLVLPARIIDAEGGKAHDVAFYSDNHGETWLMGGKGGTGDEFQIAESPAGTLVYNARVPGARMVARSDDGGSTWSEAVSEPALPAVSKGCQASVLGKGSTLYFSGIRGTKETPEYDERTGLSLYKSVDGGKSWNDGVLLYDKASGYSCLSFLPDGRLAIVFESADTPGFTRKSLPGTKPPQRPSGWMRIDVLILSDY